MSHTSWSAPASIGSAPPYHCDPSPGGVPVFSPDGHWRWAGDHWELRDDPEDEPEDDTENEAADQPGDEPGDPEHATGAPASLD